MIDTINIPLPFQEERGGGGGGMGVARVVAAMFYLKYFSNVGSVVTKMQIKMTNLGKTILIFVPTAPFGSPLGHMRGGGGGGIVQKEG